MNKETQIPTLSKTAVSDSCDCLICEFAGENMLKSQILNELKKSYEFQKEWKLKGLLKGEPHTPLQMIDARRGYVWRNLFCPICGTKVDWKTIVNNCR